MTLTGSTPRGLSDLEVVGLGVLSLESLLVGLSSIILMLCFGGQMERYGLLPLSRALRNTFYAVFAVFTDDLALPFSCLCPGLLVL